MLHCSDGGLILGVWTCLLLLLAVAVATPPTAVCGEACQELQGGAVQRIVQGLAGTQQQLEAIVPEPAKFPALAALGVPQHCLIPGDFCLLASYFVPHCTLLPAAASGGCTGCIYV